MVWEERLERISEPLAGASQENPARLSCSPGADKLHSDALSIRFRLSLVSPQRVDHEKISRGLDV